MTVRVRVATGTPVVGNGVADFLMVVVRLRWGRVGRFFCAAVRAVIVPLLLFVRGSAGGVDVDGTGTVMVVRAGGIRRSQTGHQVSISIMLERM
jgi:hypothetical protein